MRRELNDAVAALREADKDFRAGDFTLAEVAIDRAKREIKAMEKVITRLRTCPGCRDTLQQMHWDDCRRARENDMSEATRRRIQKLRGSGI